MNAKLSSILVTGGAGFIGSNFVRYMVKKYPEYKIVVLDALTYAGNRENLRDLEGSPNYEFHHGNICDKEIVNLLVKRCQVIINFAAETHVDRSILEAGGFIQTDVVGTFTLLEAAKKYKILRYIQISTDEVYGSIESGSFFEDSPLQPNSPYSASKASGDLLVRAYHRTYGLPTIITRSSNNYGPFQYPEKLIPLFITNAMEDHPLPLYGDGRNVRDWFREGAGRDERYNYLYRPGELDDEDVRQWICVDRVTFSDGAHPQRFPGGVDPWSAQADGQGSSLTRIISSHYGNDPNNWRADTPSPGSAKRHPGR